MSLTRNEKVRLLRPHHQPLFESLGIPGAYFDARAVTKFNGKIGFFDSQLKAGDIYFEITDFDTNSIDANRQLYKLPHYPDYKTRTDIFEYAPKTGNTPELYYVEIKNLEKVNPTFKPALAPLSENEFELPGTLKGEDKLYSDLNMRDGICIALKVPHSSEEWINELIRKSL